MDRDVKPSRVCEREAEQSSIIPSSSVLARPRPRRRAHTTPDPNRPSSAPPAPPSPCDIVTTQHTTAHPPPVQVRPAPSARFHLPTFSASPPPTPRLRPRRPPAGVFVFDCQETCSRAQRRPGNIRHRPWRVPGVGREQPATVRAEPNPQSESSLRSAHPTQLLVMIRLSFLSLRTLVLGPRKNNISLKEKKWVGWLLARRGPLRVGLTGPMESLFTMAVHHIVSMTDRRHTISEHKDPAHQPPRCCGVNTDAPSQLWYHRRLFPQKHFDAG